MYEKELEEHQVYKKARDAYGFDFELDMLIEECSEVIQAISKMKREPDNDNHIRHFFEEVGDVENLFQQMKFWFPAMGICVNKDRKDKLDRLERIIDREKNEGIR